ncbi:MAG: transcriptional repressor [Candidatus Krumholzibacteria bacterium]|nr:transcriptional repressor [Candidatus Krumholzibacteria bacterium]
MQTEMKEFLRTKGFKMTPQRELIFRSFFELGKHVSVDELYDRVRRQDNTVGYSTVWRNLKLICRVGLAEEVNIGDGITRYDRVTNIPHGHLYCLKCKELVEFNVEQIVGMLAHSTAEYNFTPENFKIEIQGYCENCREKESDDETGGDAHDATAHTS